VSDQTPARSVTVPLTPPLPLLDRANRNTATPTPQAASLLPPRATAEGTLRRIYETALLEFGQRGFHAVSVRDITRRVGLQASSLYAHVTSKQQLLADLIRIGHEEHYDRLRLALLEVDSDPREQIQALTRAHVGLHVTYPLLARVCNRELAALPEDGRAEILNIRLESERLFADVVNRGQRLGVFAPVDPLLAVAAIGAMGIRVAEWWDPELGPTAEEVADTYAGFATRMLT